MTRVSIVGASGYAGGELLPRSAEGPGMRTPAGLPVTIVGGAATDTPEATP